MKICPTNIPEVLVIEPSVFSDDRGYIYESYHQSKFTDVTGLTPVFVQDNHSGSFKGVLRGLHYQIHQPQGKLVRVASGEVFDVVVDLRRSSSTFGNWVGVYLSSENNRQIWVPEGFAHGFLVISDFAELLYKTTDFYAPEHERCISWDDPDLDIKWPLSESPMLSGKDKLGLSLAQSEVFA
ncbi:MAG: dTDP-4-dehydrorhamnose 3,5-epimerase [Methylophilaceae bacterium]|nr:dTDP-4-dehydrorhamnose 3,5-epimerase [Methyloradius sp.]